MMIMLKQTVVLLVMTTVVMMVLMTLFVLVVAMLLIGKACFFLRLVFCLKLRFHIR